MTKEKQTSIEDIFELLGIQDAQDKERAILDIGYRWPSQNWALLPLLDLLRFTHSELIGTALTALDEIGIDLEICGNKILELLADPNSSVSDYAESAVRKIDVSGSRIVGPLIDRLSSDEPAVRRRLFSLLRKTTTAAVRLGLETETIPLSIWETPIGGTDKAPNARAIIAFGCYDESGLKPLKMVLPSNDPFVRQLVIFSFGLIGEPAIPEIRNALSDPNDDVKREAVHSFLRIGKPIVPILQEILKGNDLVLKEEAISAIQDIGVYSSELIEGLGRLFEERSPFIRHVVLGIIAHIGIIEENGLTMTGAVPILVQALTDSDPDVRIQAAVVVEKLGINDCEVVKLLSDGSQSQDTEERTAFIKALKSLAYGGELRSVFRKAQAIIESQGET